MNYISHMECTISPYINEVIYHSYEKNPKQTINKRDVGNQTKPSMTKYCGSNVLKQNKKSWGLILLLLFINSEYFCLDYSFPMMQRLIAFVLSLFSPRQTVPEIRKMQNAIGLSAGKASQRDHIK